MAFIRRSDAFSVCMLLDTHQLEPYQGHGYHLPYDIKEKPSGLGAFPAVFSFPGVSYNQGHGYHLPYGVKKAPLVFRLTSFRGPSFSGYGKNKEARLQGLFFRFVLFLRTGQ